MATFNYVARDTRGKIRKGKMNAESPQALIRELRGKGLFVTEHRQAQRGKAKRGGKLSEISLTKPKVKTRELMLFSRQFASMISAGLDVIECLEILGKQSDNPTLSEALTDIRDDVMEGKPMSEALAKHPKIFDNLYVNMIAAAETTGSFSGPLEDLASMLEKTEEIKRKVKSAIRTPLMTLCFALVITFGLIKFAVPTFAKMYGDPSKLPAATQVLLAVSDTLQGPKGLGVMGGIVVFIFLFRMFIKSPNGRLIWDRAKLKIPLMGPIFLKRSIVLFSRTLGLLLTSGVDYLGALTIVADVADNKVIKGVLDEAREAISRGEDLSDSFAKSGLFPPLVVQLVGSGVKTGKVPEMLGHIGKIYEVEVDQSVEALTEALNPILTICLGVLVGGVLIGLYMPVFSFGETLM